MYIQHHHIHHHRHLCNHNHYYHHHQWWHGDDRWNPIVSGHFHVTLSKITFFSFFLSLFATFYCSLSLFYVQSCKIAPTSLWNWLCSCCKREQWSRWKYVQLPLPEALAKYLSFHELETDKCTWRNIWNIYAFYDGGMCGYWEVELVTNNWSSSHPPHRILWSWQLFCVFPILWSWQFFRRKSCTRRCGYANVMYK